MLRGTLALVVLSGLAANVGAHYNILLPSSPAAKKGEPVAFTYQWGHPFEHELFDAPSPACVLVLTPDGKRQELTKSLEKFKVPGGDGKDVTAFRLTYTPDVRGDHTIVLHTPPIWLEESKEYVQDIVKVVLHVQVQKSWDMPSDKDFQLVPLTRPYGLLPGMTFQGRVAVPRIRGDGPDPDLTPRPVAGALIEFERYHAVKPKELPEDELITFKTKADVNGVFTCSFPDPGWWCVTAQRDAGTRERDGKPYPLRQRATLWLHVDARK
jgi:cobalt/nickel transport protein